MSYPHPSLGKVMDDESHYQKFDDPLASDGSDFEEIAIVKTDDLFSDDDSFFSLTSIEISKLKDMRRGWNNRASALGTDETIIIDAENDLNLQEKRIQHLYNNTPYNTNTLYNTINLTVFRKKYTTQLFYTHLLHGNAI